MASLLDYIIKKEIQVGTTEDVLKKYLKEKKHEISNNSWCAPTIYKSRRFF